MYQGGDDLHVEIDSCREEMEQIQRDHEAPYHTDGLVAF